jgi:lipooligosaccharide transport system permease protein
MTPPGARPQAAEVAAGPAAGSFAHRLARVVVLPAGAGMARVMVERNLTASRRSWPVLLSGFFEPVFYLFSLGIGLGALVASVPVDGRPVAYPVFVAPALLAASAMNGAVYDSTLNVFFKLKYLKLYDAVLATPLGPRDVAIGEIGWAQLRGGVYAAMFVLVMLLLGVLPSWWAVLALPAALVVGLAFAAVGMAATTYMRSWQDFDLVNLAVLPMFLFSATFYPLSVYPRPLQWVVEATPLYHAVELIRALTLGIVGWPVLGHLLYLVALGLAGVLVAARRLERLLLR